MFIFSTNTIINSLERPGFVPVDPKHIGEDAPKRFWVEENDSHTIMRIARNFRFDKNNVVAIFKRAYNKPKYFKVTFDLKAILDKSKPTDANGNKGNVQAGNGRIALYIGLSGSLNSYYANDFVYKGKPFYVEFLIKDNDDATKLAKRIVATAKKFQNMVYEYPLVKVYTEVTGDDTKLVFEGTDEYQVIRKADLEWFNEDKKTYDCCATFGDFEKEDEGVVVEQGKQGFGTFRQLTKDMRLPTAANTRWDRVLQDESPTPENVYNEYIVYQCVNRGIMGGDAVGQLVKSGTYHVFYVADGEVSKKFEEALTKLHDIETVDKDLDDVALEKQVVEDSYDNLEAIRDAETAAHGSKNDNTGAKKTDNKGTNNTENNK